MGSSFQRGMNALVGAGMIGSAVAAVAAVVHVGWALAPVGLPAAVLGVVWGVSFVHGVVPVRAVSNHLVRRVQEATDEMSTAANVKPPVVAVSPRAANAYVAWCNGRPRLTFPARWAERLSDEQLRAYVAHELAHTDQPRFRQISSSQLAGLVSGANLGVGIVTLSRLLGSTALDAHVGLLIAYAVMPLALTLALVIRRVVLLPTLMWLELDADRQAVARGASAEVLATTLERLRGPELTVRQPLHERVLRVALLHALPRLPKGERARRVRALGTER